MYLRIKFKLLVLTVFLLSGCMGGMPGRQPTAEELAVKQQFMQAFLANKSGGAIAPVASTPEASNVVISEASLLNKINAFPALTKKVAFTQKQNGLLVNGKKLVDPEGAIKLYGYNHQTGDVTYLLDAGNNTFIYKYVRATTDQDPVKLGNAEFNRGTWKVTTVSGKSMRGEKLILLGKGFIIGGEDVFVWAPGTPTQTFSVPQGFQIADYQNGDISGTRFVLCERMIEGNNDSAGSFGALLNSVNSLGSTLGITNKEDYLLLNIDTAREVPINISYDKKNEAVHSNCQPSGKYINKCANVQFVDSLYDKYGMINGGHYYWSINWYNTASGNILIYKDNNTRDLVAQNLNTDQKAVILTRMLGINWFTSSQSIDGKVSVNAKMGFGNEAVADVENALTLKFAEVANKGK